LSLPYFFLSLIRCPPRVPLFPYTTLFRSFGGGQNDVLKNFSGRFDIDLQLLWEFQSLGFGNRARMNERRAEYEIATLDLFRTQRSEEHTSELQSRVDLVCRLLLEKKKKYT